MGALFDAAGRGTKLVPVLVNGREFLVPRGASCAAAVLLAGFTATRTSPADGSQRAPYCMMGVCFECLMTIDGESDQQACLVPVRAGCRIDLTAAAGES